MEEKLLVFNPTQSNISLSIKPNNIDIDLTGLAQHHSRRRIREAFVQILILKNQSVDVVKLTGLSIKDIKASSEFHGRIKRGQLKIISETHIVDVSPDELEEERVAKAPEAPPEELVVPSLVEFNSLIDALNEVKANPPPVERIVEIVEETGTLEESTLEVDARFKPKVKTKAKTKSKAKIKRKKVNVKKEE